MTLDPRKKKIITIIKPTLQTETISKTKLTKENFEDLQRLTGSGLVSISKKISIFTSINGN